MVTPHDPNAKPDYESVLDQCMVLYGRNEQLPEMVERLCAYVAWVRTGLCMIRDQSQHIIPLVHNRIQRIEIGAAMFQAARGLPVRQLELKARKGGSSTLWQTVMVFFGAMFPNQVGLMLAHVPDSTKEIFQIAKLASKHFPVHVDPLEMSLRWPNTTNSRYYCHTAGGTSVGAGGTPSILHLSEVALYKINKAETLTAATKAVPNEPNTILIMESTARGREEFFNKFEEARNDPDHPYVAIFIPWFLDERLEVIPPDDMEYDDDERILISLARREYAMELSNGQLEWRRNEIKATIGGLPVFRQEYPSTPEEAVQGSSDLILPGMRECIVDELSFDPAHVQVSELTGGIDYGYNDPTVVITAIYRDQVLTIIDVYRKREGLASDHVSAIWEGHTYWFDPSEVGGREEMRKELVKRKIEAKLIPAPRRKEGRSVGFVKAELETVQTLIHEGRLQILRSASEQLVLEADSYQWNPKTDMPDDRRSEECGHFDTMDALRYCVMGVGNRSAVESVVMPTQKSRRMEWRV